MDDADTPRTWRGAEGARTIVAFLGRTPTFSALGPGALQRLVEICDILDVKPGGELFAQGSLGTDAFLVLEGGAAVLVNTDRGPVTVAQVGAGGVVGEIGAFAGLPRTATVVATGPMTCLRIDRDAVRTLTAESPDVAMAIIAELGRRLENQNGAIAVLTQAAHALAAGQFEPDMLAALREQADRFSHFAEVFLEMAEEIQRKKSLAQEMQTAAEIQQSFLPTALRGTRHADRFRVAAQMIPAAHVGGDFYDYFRMDDDRIAVAVGDVAGKGVPASMFMSVTRTVIKTIARQETDPGVILARANDLLAEDNNEGMFVTVVLAVLDFAAGSFRIASCGHEEIFLLGPGGVEETFRPTGPALGLFEGIEVGSAARPMRPGAMLAFATDGISEAFDEDGSLFGPNRTLDLFAGLAGSEPAALVRAVFARVRDFAGAAPQSDDITCLAVKFL